MIAATWAAGCSPPEPPNVLFIVMDTTRADHLSISGWHRDTTPHLRALLDDAVHYSEARSVAPWTLPSHMSMFTGELPGVHRATWAAYDAGPAATFWSVRRSRFRSPFPERMLPRRLKEAGYDTVGVSCNPWVSARTGFDVGFDALHAAWASDLSPDPELPASTFEIPLELAHAAHPMGKALFAFNRHLRQQQLGGRFFLFFNFMDAHYPYVSARDKGLEFGGDAQFFDSMADPQTRRNELDIMAGSQQIDFDKLGPFYDSSIHTVDWAVGRLVSWLKEHDLYDRTMIIVTSDHGEHLGEDGLFSHQLSVREELLRVPLVIKYPHSARAGTVENNPFVSVADLYQTILEPAGALGDPAGYSLNLARMDDWTRPYSVAEYYFSDSYLARFRKRNPEFDVEAHRRVFRVIYAADRKLVFADADLVEAGPLDRSAALPRDPELEGRLAEWLRQYVARLDQTAISAPPDPEAPSDPEQLEFVEALRALGYVR